MGDDASEIKVVDPFDLSNDVRRELDERERVRRSTTSQAGGECPDMEEFWNPRSLN